MAIIFHQIFSLFYCNIPCNTNNHNRKKQYSQIINAMVNSFMDTESSDSEHIHSQLMSTDMRLLRENQRWKTTNINSIMWELSHWCNLRTSKWDSLNLHFWATTGRNVYQVNERKENVLHSDNWSWEEKERYKDKGRF